MKSQSSYQPTFTLVKPRSFPVLTPSPRLYCPLKPFETVLKLFWHFANPQHVAPQQSQPKMWKVYNVKWQLQGISRISINFSATTFVTQKHIISI